MCDRRARIKKKRKEHIFLSFFFTHLSSLLLLVWNFCEFGFRFSFFFFTSSEFYWLCCVLRSLPRVGEFRFTRVTEQFQPIEGSDTTSLEKKGKNCCVIVCAHEEKRKNERTNGKVNRQEIICQYNIKNYAHYQKKIKDFFFGGVVLRPHPLTTKERKRIFRTCAFNKKILNWNRFDFNCSIMKNHSGALLGEKLPFYQKVLNMTLGITTGQSSGSTRKAEESLAPSPFRRGYTRAAAAGRPGIPVTPIHVVTTPGHPAHMGTGGGTTTSVTSPVSTPTKHGSSTAASIFRSFRRRSLRRSFRRTKSFLVKTPTPGTPTPTITNISTGIHKSPASE